ncbi:Cytochrome oxidase assembly protein ShyY1 [Microbacterium sp. cf046]|uniref:SURF1 family cytochrome oxidase biogenesis protein n=1 Tax=Microbacterium sp. cf046 TaxID=1761803 RepID=UPI0008E74B77|nr:SURF1 family protein [Microbacterium sp. cf046]SFS04234.1 Cytochrome oxidase assembly protein ShyY1 [Microbacterium sp. cf046]
MSRATAPPAVRWTAYVAVAIVFAIACAFLSNWQFSRNAARAEQLALVAQNYDADPVPLSDVIAPGGSLAADDEWQPVRLEGEYLAADQILVRNRPHGGTAAFEVLVPFRDEDGRILLIDRGWVPPGEDQPLPDEIPAPPEGQVTVIARLRPAEPLPASGRSAPEGQVPSINPGLVADLVDPGVGAGLEPTAYGAMVSEDPAPATRPAAFAAPSEDPGPHLSYAVQWILFAIMGFVFIGYVIRTERRHRREDAEDRARGIDPSPRHRTPARRNDRDMQDEDSILDAAGR